MTTNTKTALRTIADWPITDPANMDAANMADVARAALTTAAAVPPEGVVMVPVELANRVQESLGEFLMDHGWSQRDMDTSDEFGAVLLAADPKAEPVPAGEYPPLPTGSAWCGDDDVRDFGAGPGESALMFEPTQTQHVPLFTAGQMRAYVDADRAMRAQAAPAAVKEPSDDAIFEFWWADHMPNSTQEEAWAEWCALRLNQADTQAAPQPAVQQGDALDAARYRWLRNPTTNVAMVLDKRTGYVPGDERVPGIGGYYTYEYRAGDELDAAIDAARAQAKEGA